MATRKTTMPETRLEASFDGHPDRLCGEEVEVIAEGSDGGEQRLVEAGAGVEADADGDFSPRDFGALGDDLVVGWILTRNVAGKLRGHSHKGMQNHEDTLEDSAIGAQQRLGGKRIGELLRIHRKE